MGRDMARSLLANYTSGCPVGYDLSEETMKPQKKVPVTDTRAGGQLKAYCSDLPQFPL